MTSQQQPDFYALLKDTSRSFYLGIMGLKQPLRDRVCSGYLFCRLMDIFEDASVCAPESRSKLLASIRVFLSQLKHDAATLERALATYESERLAVVSSLEAYFVAHPHERALFDNSLALLRSLTTLPLSVRVAFSGSLMDMALGMESEIEAERLRTPRWSRSTQDFDQYCYTVAGTVGIFLTQLFWDEGAFEGKMTLNELEKLGESFGKSLQTVNIAKDFHQDWQEGRCYWPQLLGPGGVGTIAPSQAELKPVLSFLIKKFEKYAAEAALYTDAISTKRNDIRFFCDFPLQMAKATMRIAAESDVWLEKGGAPKVSKPEALLLFQKLSLVYALPQIWND